MPAPWPDDDIKNATLQNLANALGPDVRPHCETAWHMVRGQPGFEQIDNGDDYHYVNHHWPSVEAGFDPQKAKTPPQA